MLAGVFNRFALAVLVVVSAAAHNAPAQVQVADALRLQSFGPFGVTRRPPPRQEGECEKTEKNEDVGSFSWGKNSLMVRMKWLFDRMGAAWKNLKLKFSRAARPWNTRRKAVNRPVEERPVEQRTTESNATPWCATERPVDEVIVAGVDGTNYSFVVQGTPPADDSYVSWETGRKSSLRHKVYSNNNAKLSRKQKYAQPTLIMAETDYDRLSKNSNIVTHTGFGGYDYFDEISTPEGLFDEGVQAVALWKIPIDLMDPEYGGKSDVKGMEPFVNVNLAVGEYSSSDNSFGLVKDEITSIEDVDVFRRGIEATKLRVDFNPSEGLYGVSALANTKEAIEKGIEYSTKVAMITTMAVYTERGENNEKGKNIFDQYGPQYNYALGHNEGEKALKRFILAFYEKWKIYVYHCEDHHAMVFYKDVQENQLITPERMACLMDDLKVNDVLNTFNLQDWKTSYQKQYKGENGCSELHIVPRQ